MEILTKSGNGQWSLEKSNHSVFSMDHVRQVSSMPNHSQAKKFAHDIVDSSTANPKNKAQINRDIASTRSSTHLAGLMSNHILAHPSEGLKTIK